MEKLVLLLSLVTLSLASECGPIQRLKVLDQWAESYGTGHNRIEFGRDVFKSFLESHSDLKEKVFSRVKATDLHSPEFEAHAARVMGGIDICISLLRSPTTLDQALDHLHHQHNAMGLENSYFDAIAMDLLHAIEKRVTGRFDLDAWKACGKMIIDGVKPNKEEDGSGNEEIKEEGEEKNAEENAVKSKEN